MRRAAGTFVGLGLALGLAAAADRPAPAIKPSVTSEVKDLYFGEALYHAYLGQYFDALQRLDTELGQYHGLDEPRRDTLHPYIEDAEFSVGDFELDYRMHQRAGRAIKAVLEGAVDESVRNEAAFRLARILFQKDEQEDAQQALDRIQGRIPDVIKDDVEFLRANIDLASGRPAEAVDVLQKVRGEGGLAGFVAYNLGIALFQDGKPEAAVEQLDKAGKLQAGDDAGQAIRDKSNLVLGSMLFESGAFDRAKQSLDRVRIEGPFSNQALLRAGWAEATAKHYDRALVPWNLLVDRDPTDAAVQEAMLAVPNAYSSLDLNGRAAVMYGRALELYSHQIDRVDASIDSVRQGRFLEDLVREESRQDDTWVVRLRSLPGAPETYYLTEVMASHDFQTALHNYLDLEDLKTRLQAWTISLDAFEDIIRLRRQNYEPLLPPTDAQFRELDSRMRLRLEQRRHIAERLQTMLTSPRPEELANADELAADAALDRLDKQIGGAKGPREEALRERVARLRGVLTWNLVTQYDARLTAAYKHLKELDADIEVLNTRYDAFVRTRQAATHSYVGYDAVLAGLRGRAGTALQRVTAVMEKQGRMIETVAVDQLEARRDRLAAQQTQARYGVADSYDRASRAQSGAESR
jgi:tetratricopeptide (TPR) repeat protein